MNNKIAEANMKYRAKIRKVVDLLKEVIRILEEK